VILEHVNDAEAFRASVRDWLARVLPRRPGSGDSDDDFATVQRWWMTELNKVGLGTPHWPAEYGGVDLDQRLRAILAEEFARCDAPSLAMFVISLNHVPATLLAWGSEYQKKTYMPEVANGQIWCQGFSEPNAGSDLASLRTRAERRGDHYVVNGQKIWSSYSMYASRAILLARTDPTAAKHAGISYFLLDMKAPGVEVRPIRQINGKAKFGEIFLTDVRIPVEERVGEEGQGWAVAQTTLSAERGLLSFELAERLHNVMERFLRDSVNAQAGWLEDHELRRRYVRLFGRLQALRGLMRDALLKEPEGATQALIASVTLKVVFSEVRKEIGELLIDTGRPDGHLVGDTSDDLASGAMFVYLTSFAFMLGGGTNEIMRNIVAERGLNMPRG
jgi:alkylation response protein AidB-like acyl-CoA dehydrogenase